MLFDESRKFDASANIGVRPPTEPAIGDPIEQHMSRRDALARLGVAALANVLAPAAREAAEPTACTSSSGGISIPTCLRAPR